MDKLAFSVFPHRKIVSVTQNIDDFNIPRSDVRYPRSRVRKFLGRHGMKGIALKEEVDRITFSYSYSVALFKDGFKTGTSLKEVSTLLNVRDHQNIDYPYGWQKKCMTRLMKRMFHGRGKEVFPTIVDKAYSLFA